MSAFNIQLIEQQFKSPETLPIHLTVVFVSGMREGGGWRVMMLLVVFTNYINETIKTR